MRYWPIIKHKIRGRIMLEQWTEKPGAALRCKTQSTGGKWRENMRVEKESQS